jgi:hypothetical protein
MYLLQISKHHMLFSAKSSRGGRIKSNISKLYCGQIESGEKD